MFDRYFCFRLIAILEEHVQPYILNGNVIISGGHLQWSPFFSVTVFLSDKHLQSSRFNGIKLVSPHQLQPSFFYYKSAVAATYTLKFTCRYPFRHQLFLRIMYVFHETTCESIWKFNERVGWTEDTLNCCRKILQSPNVAKFIFL